MCSKHFILLIYFFLRFRSKFVIVKYMIIMCLCGFSDLIFLYCFYLHYWLIIFLQAKVNNASLVGIGYTQSLRPGKTPPPVGSDMIKRLPICLYGHLKKKKNDVNVFTPGMKLTLSALVDGKNINAGGHKLGLGLELEA